MNLVALRFVVFILCLTPAYSHGQDWPALRGPLGNGVAKSQGLQGSKKFSLKVAWKKKLGSGYSSVSIADQSAFTMYSSGDQDKLGCFDIKTGDTKWEFSLDRRFKGENGSFDGPISTPLIHGGKVYGLSCQGRLVCVDAGSGKLVWEKSLTESFEVKQPLYGFSTSPIIAAGNLVLQVGAKDAMVVAMDPASGEVKWTSGSDSVSSQIPTLVNIKGVEVILAAAKTNLTGINPETGDIVFEFEHGGGNGSAVMPVAIGDDNVLITVDDAFSKSVNLRPIDDQKIAASEQWQERSIKNTYNVPTLSGGNLFAFSTRILTCVDPKSGKPRWKSRKPGDGFLMAVDDKIAIITKQGSAHLINATSEKYDEIDSVKLFDDLVWTIPAFSDNAIFVRSLGELARVDIIPDSNTSTEKNGESLPMSKSFADLLESLNDKDATAANALIDKAIANQRSFPIVDSGIVHFLYRGPEDDVALASDVFGARQERKMLPAGKSDLKYYTMKLEDDQRANYVFLVNFKPQTDKLNSRSATSSMYAGEMEFAVRLRNEEPLKMSWFAMENWKQPLHLETLPEKLNGKIVQQSLPGEGEAPALALDVYLPPGYDDGKEKRFPVVYVVPHMRFETSQFIESADNLFTQKADGIRPAILVVPKGQMAPGTETKIVALIDKEYRTIAERGSRSAAGFGFSGGAVFGALASNPDMFGAISVQSPLVFGTDGVLEGMKNLKQPTRVYLDWGRFDMHNPVENWDIRKTCLEIFSALEKLENVSVSGGMANDSADWSSWKNRYDKVLRTLTAE